MRKITNLFTKLSKLAINQITITLIVSMYIVLPFNLINLSKYSFLEFLSSLFSTLSVVLIFLFLSSYVRILFILLSFLLISINTIAFYFIYKYQVSINLNIIMALFNTDVRESLDFLNINIVIYFFVFAVLPSLIIAMIKIKKVTLKNLFTAFIIIIFFSVLSNFVFKRNLITYGSNSFAKFLPIDGSFLPISYLYFLIRYSMLSFGDFTYKDLSKISTYSIKKQKEPLNIVFIIGESSRVDHYSAYGYKKNTTPNISQIKNLVFFKNNTSCNTSTIPSVSCLLSNIDGKTFRANLKYYLKNEVSSFITIFDHLNFKTYFATTNTYKLGDPMFRRFKTIQNINYISDDRFKENITDLNLLPFLKTFIDEKSTKNKLVILHTIGSHFKYRARYTTTKWTPACTETFDYPSECTQQSLINDYDNTLLVTDELIAKSIETLKNKNAILIFTADHGENLGELNKYGQRLYLHGNDFSEAGEQVIHVPLIIWFSDKYIKYNGSQFLKNAKRLVHSEINHDFIFHSILDCAGIKNKEVINTNLSICSANF